MSNKKTVHLTLVNHDYMKRIAYLNDTSIELEVNKTISNKRIEELEIN